MDLSTVDKDKYPLLYDLVKYHNMIIKVLVYTAFLHLWANIVEAERKEVG